MKLAELFPALTAAALRIRHEGDVPLAEGLETLVLKLSAHAASEVEDLPLEKAAAKSKAKRPARASAVDDAAILSQLEDLIAHARDAEMTLDAIRSKVSALCSPVPLAMLRKVGKTFIHLPLSQKSKGEIQDLIYSQIARRKDRTSW